MRWLYLVPMLLVACAGNPFEIVTHPGAVQGRVVDMDGFGIAGASVEILQGGAWGPATTTDGDGHFAAGEDIGSRWIRASATGFFPRVRPAAVGEDTVVRLSEDDGDTIVLEFGGDMMFGRRYYDPDEDGRDGDGLIRRGMEALDIPSLLEGVAPLLSEADITSVNLETPLGWTGERHPTKEYVFTSDPQALDALRAAGVDLINFANNHVYDYTEGGLEATLAAATERGWNHLGAGMTERDAWTPSVVEVRGTRVAFLGCTSITGTEHAVSYVADDAYDKGGAARCAEPRLTAAVHAARAEADLVVIQLHGGMEYAKEPSHFIADYTERAIAAGADLVINHHPHVLQGLSLVDDHLVAWSMGNLAFDQTLWATLPSALLQVHMGTDGTLKRAFLEPLLIEDFQPRGLRGWPQERTAREVLGLSDLVAALDDGALEIDRGDRAVETRRSLDVEGPSEGWSEAIELRDGWVDQIRGADAWRLGRDLLLVGDFEDTDIDDDVAEGTLWDLSSRWEGIASDAAHSGEYGLRLHRDYGDDNAIAASPRHRIGLPADRALTVSGWYRTEGALTVQLSWYADTRGESASRDRIELAPSATWARFEVDAEAPADAIAVGLYLSLDVPERAAVVADLDELRLISWSDQAPANTARYDQLQVRGHATVHTLERTMP
jgi:poly-gamma-glutamate capsule biosynthesis protein CapA/YwtB (metallophosphatase superfamily)